MERAVKFARFIRENWSLLSGLGRGITELGIRHGYDLGWLRSFLIQHDKPTRENDTMRDIQAYDSQERAIRKRASDRRRQELEHQLQVAAQRRIEELGQLIEETEQKLHEASKRQEEAEKLRQRIERQGLFAGRNGRVGARGQRVGEEIINNEDNSREKGKSKEIVGKGRKIGEVLGLREKEGGKAETEVFGAGARRKALEDRITDERRRREEALCLKQDNAERTRVEEQNKGAREKKRIEEEKVIERALEKEKQRFEEERRVCEEEERRLKHNILKVSGEGYAPEKDFEKRFLEEGRSRGTQPLVWPSREEIQNAKAKAQYSQETFAFAVAGASGSGKSTLINVFLNSNTAPTGVIETTAEIGRYPDPGNQPPHKETVWYDIPGAGTLNIPGWQYFNAQGLFVFDLIIIMIGDRFTELDFDILENCRRCNIPSFIVRSKADQHIRNMMRESGYDSDCEIDENLRRRCRTDFITQTRQSIDSQLRDRGVPLQKIYIVSASKEFRRLYSSLNINSGLQEEVDTIDKKGRFIDELDLIFDILTTSRARRCDTAGRDLMLAQQTVFHLHTQAELIIY